MYIISPQFIRDYITEKFSDVGKLSANAREFILESIFVENDWKRHMSINIDSGLWQCFKTGRTGNFTSFYAHVENVPYFRAQRDLAIKNFDYLGEDIHIDERPHAQLELDTSELYPITINSGNSNDPTMLDAWSFLFGRGLFNELYEEEEPFYLCKKGTFQNRIIIPFTYLGTVFYYQGRSIYGEKPKYLNPSTEVAPKPSEILYPYDEEEDLLVVCEGPLDALSLHLRGVNATCTIGSSTSPTQAEMLSTFKGRIIMGYDNDEAGQRGIDKFDRLRKERRMEPFEVCFPPSGHKDWNSAHIANFDLDSHITRNSMEYNFDYKARLSLEKL